MIDLSDKSLLALRELCDGTTGGPWVSFVEGRDHTSGSSFIRTAGSGIELSGASEQDQEFIAQCRQYVPALVDEVLRLRSLRRSAE